MLHNLQAIVNINYSSDEIKPKYKSRLLNINSQLSSKGYGFTLGIIFEEDFPKYLYKFSWEEIFTIERSKKSNFAENFFR